jgi:hypothetical protein
VPGEIIVGIVPPPEAFSTRKMSVNRERYSLAPQDVLYNTESGAHYFTWAIVAITVGSVESIEFVHPKLKDVKYTLRSVHRPARCMYAHCEVEVLENGIPRDEVRPKSVRTWIKDALAEKATMTKMPGV